MTGLWSGTNRRSRARRGWPAPGLSLFPFLAVLISTMGALIILIVIMARQGQRAAFQAQLAKERKTREELTSALELLEWQIGVLHESLQAGQEKLRESRAVLGHLEDHARRLLRQREQLVHQLKGSAVAPAGTSPEELRRQLAQLDEQLETLKREVERLSRERPAPRRLYSIIPYEGPYGTRRRPIYLECRRDAIVLQPEGIRFVPEDFQGDLGPGNPLDSALRAIREYFVRTGVRDEDPYPLLLVRPSGIAAFYVARAALEPWSGEFGYELIGEDWELAFPTAEPLLAREIMAAVELARSRLRAVAALSSRRFASAPRRFVVSPDGGGLIAEGGGSRSIWDRDGSGDEYPTGRRDREIASFAGPRDSAGGGPDPIGTSHMAGSVPAEMDTGTEEEAGRQGGTRPAATGQVGPKGEGADTPQFVVTPGPEGKDRSLTSGSPDLEGYKQNLSEGSNTNFVGYRGSLAQIRGENWALPVGSRALTPIWRPIKIRCLREAIVLEPEEGLGQPVWILWQSPPERTVDELVGAIWQYVETWGPAGRGMAWRPVLKVKVIPGAEAHAQLLRELLDGSGLPIEFSGP